jgi:hypothetical protein
VKGTADPGSTVVLYTSADCSDVPVATGSADDFASPGLVVSVPDDSITTFRATATDDAGNVSACSAGSVSYTEDSTPPAVPLLTDTDPDSPANANSPRVKGKADVGSTVRLYTSMDCPDPPVAIGPAAGFASPGLVVSVSDDSTTTFRATAADAAGNTSRCSRGELTPGEPPVFREYYDLAADPWQLTNYLGDADHSNDPSAETIESLHDQLVSDLNCGGQGGLSGLPPCP